MSCKTVDKRFDENPLLREFNTQFGVPPFDLIKHEHYVPAFDEAIKQKKNEIQKIIDNPAEPTFSNTIEALEFAGERIQTIENIFENQNLSNTDSVLQIIAKETAPKLSALNDDILLNDALFQKVKKVYESVDTNSLTKEQHRLLKETYKKFARSGANLPVIKKNRLKEINAQLAVLLLKFNENTLTDVNKFKLVIENKDDLAGLPENIIQTAAYTANKSGDTGKWVFTIQKPSMIPFLQYAENRDLRQKLYEAYLNCSNHDDASDNKKVIIDILRLRIEKANLLGFSTYADFALEENMAHTPQNVFNRLNQLWEAALPVAKQEAAEMQKIIDSEGKHFKLDLWDWWYYAEKIRKARYDFDEESVKPYFELNEVRDGMMMVINKLYGLQFKLLADIPKPNKDVQAYEVLDSDSSHLGILYMDFHPRAGKSAGAWMSEYRRQYKKGEESITPIVTTVFNFSIPTENSPALLTLVETETFFHEIGHALHGLLSKCTYPSLSGTSVALDFVELPSQIMENWALAPEVLKLYAHHYKTGDPMPDELIAKLKRSSKFNQGFNVVEYLAASILDMDYHILTSVEGIDVPKFEKEAMDKIGLIPEIAPRYRSTYFRHIFSNDYCAGYYSYTWAELLDADAFEAFVEKGLFNKDVASMFRHEILEKGGIEDPMVLYRNFRGRDPEIEPLLKRKGL